MARNNIFQSEKSSWKLTFSTIRNNKKVKIDLGPPCPLNINDQSFAKCMDHVDDLPSTTLSFTALLSFTRPEASSIVHTTCRVNNYFNTKSPPGYSDKQYLSDEHPKAENNQKITELWSIFALCMAHARLLVLDYNGPKCGRFLKNAIIWPPCFIQK